MGGGEREGEGVPVMMVGGWYSWLLVCCSSIGGLLFFTGSLVIGRVSMVDLGTEGVVAEVVLLSVMESETID